MAAILPGWNSLEAVAKWHRWFEIAGFVALALLLVFEILAYVYGNRKDQLTTIAPSAAPRHLSDSQRGKIAHFLAKEPRGNFTIKANITVPDARGYADEIAALFRDAGWNVRVDNAIITGPDIKAVWITIKNQQAPPASTVTLQQAFKAGGLSIPIKFDTTMPDELWLLVSSK